jgi:hypothetical protein
MTTPHDAELDRLAAGEIDDTDVRVLDQLAHLYDTLDPVPAGLVERIAFGITLDALHAEIADLQRTGDLAGVRSGEATEAQTVTFTSASLSLMITVSPLSAELARIDGWVAPGDGASVELRTATERMERTADADGRFVFENAPRGLGQFVVRLPGQDEPHPPVITPSIEF